MSHKPPIYDLGNNFYDTVKPSNFPQKKLRFFNNFLKLENIPGFTKEHLWHFKPLENNLTHPLALRYHGHQFRHYNPDLGDGRGFLYAQIPVGNTWFDLGTKGSGTTPYSRQGDGRLTLKGAVREVLATELLESYGVNTSKTACVFETGENLIRHDEPSPTRSAVLTRYSHSHIRIGTFQRLAYLNEIDNIKKLSIYVLKNYYSDESANLDFENSEKVVHCLFDNVSLRLAQLTAQVMIAGFVHGVLNSDNINVSGELFDYGPYRFLPDYNPDFTAAYFDHQGLYSYSEQPTSFYWNLGQFAEVLLKAYPEFDIRKSMSLFENQFHGFLLCAFENKLNLKFENIDAATQALSLFFKSVSLCKINFEEAFFRLNAAQTHQTDERDFQTSNYDFPEYMQMESVLDLKKLLKKAKILNPDLINHAYFKNEKPQTLIIDEIEKIWGEISEHDNWTLFENKIQSIRLFRGCYKL